MARRKDGRPRLITGVVSSLDFKRGRPFFYTSMPCSKGDHKKCDGCPACECHLFQPKE